MPAGRPMASASRTSATRTATRPLWVQEVFGGARVNAGFVHRRFPSNPATCVRPDHAAGLQGQPDFGARCRCWPATAAGMRPAGAGCTATNCTTARSVPSEVHYFHCAATSTSCPVVIPQARPRFTSQNGFRRMPALIEREFPAGDADRASGAARGQRPAAGIRQVPLRRPARAHELRRPLPQHARNACSRSRTRKTSTSSTTCSSTRKSASRTSATSSPAAARIPASGKRLLFHAQEFHTSFWGHMGLLNLEDHYLLPDYAAYQPHRATRAPGPTTARSRTSRARRARSSATCTSRISRSTRRRRKCSRTSCRRPSRTARWTTSR